MRKARFWIGAGVGIALLLGVRGLRAQAPAGEFLAPPKEGQPLVMPHGGNHTTVHPNGHGAHAEHHAEHNVVEEEHEEEGGLYGWAEYLYLRPRRRAHDFVIVDPVLDNSIGGTISSLDWETNSAYRLAAGYKVGHGWEVGAVYFYLHSKDERSVSAPAGGALFATLTAPDIDQASNAQAGSNIDMDVIDVELAKRLELHECLALRLSAGPRFATIQQKLNAFYTGGTAGVGSIVSSPISFDGYGIKTGADALFKLWGGAGVYARANMSLLCGDFETRLTQVNNGGQTFVVDVGDKFRKVVPITEMGLGIAWENENVRLSVGYEIANFFNLVDSLDFIEGASFGKIGRRTSDLSYEGFSAAVGFSY